MAQRTGMTVKMNNSDDEQRKYDISCEVTVEDNKAKEVRNLSVNKEGMQVAYGMFNALQNGTPNVSLNFHALPTAEHAACTAAIYAFVEQVVNEVMETE